MNWWLCRLLVQWKNGCQESYCTCNWILAQHPSMPLQERTHRNLFCNLWRHWTGVIGSTWQTSLEDRQQAHLCLFRLRRYCRQSLWKATLNELLYNTDRCVHETQSHQSYRHGMLCQQYYEAHNFLIPEPAAKHVTPKTRITAYLNRLGT